MIKFFCKCGKEMWQNVDWESIKHFTLDEVKHSLKCSDCVHKEMNNK